MYTKCFYSIADFIITRPAPNSHFNAQLKTGYYKKEDLNKPP